MEIRGLVPLFALWALIAAVDHPARDDHRRLSLSEPIRASLSAAGVEEFASARLRVDIKRGYLGPAAAFAESWRSAATAWRTALAADLHAVGAGHALADDGWHVLVVVLVEDAPPLPEPRELERAAFDAVNHERTSRGFPVLERDERLTRVAREHSVDMARRAYFDHRAPDGELPADRVRRSGIRFREIAEDIHRNRGFSDPVRRAVQGWLDSPPHRRTMLDRDYSRSGLGVHVSSDGELYFTQLFLLPTGGQ